jgi:hypothetical protein
MVTANLLSTRSESAATVDLSPLRGSARSSGATARTATGDERERLWSMMSEIWPDYDKYAGTTDREIPVVVLTPDT